MSLDAARRSVSLPGRPGKDRDENGIDRRG